MGLGVESGKQNEHSGSQRGVEAMVKKNSRKKAGPLVVVLPLCVDVYRDVE
jgi:hypothetical protein